MMFEKVELPMIAPDQFDRAPAAPQPSSIAGLQGHPLRSAEPRRDSAISVIPRNCGSVDKMTLRDPAMVALMDRIALIAASTANILISGEIGTGKELVATSIHRSSQCSAGPFIILNCAALPDALLEGYPSSHERRCAANLSSPQTDIFDTARGGTLLLDEVGDMNLCTQAKLLAILQQHELGRMEGLQSARDVRIIASTSCDLREKVRIGQFRAALYFRFNVLTLKIPPLRDRPADIVPLAEFFAAEYARANEIAARPLSAESVDILLRHPWPGNVRELRNVMHRAVLTASGHDIGPPALDIDAAEGIGAQMAVTRNEESASVQTTGRTIEAVEKDMILGTLLQCKGNRNQTSTVLGISIRTLRNKLHEYERSGTRIPRPVIVAVA